MPLAINHIGKSAWSRAQRAMGAARHLAQHWGGEERVRERKQSTRLELHYGNSLQDRQQVFVEKKETLKKTTTKQTESPQMNWEKMCCLLVGLNPNYLDTDPDLDSGSYCNFQSDPDPDADPSPSPYPAPEPDPYFGPDYEPDHNPFFHPDPDSGRLLFKRDETLL